MKNETRIAYTTNQWKCESQARSLPELEQCRGMSETKESDTFYRLVKKKRKKGIIKHHRENEKR